MINLITHFYNEEYLLPFWIEWHKKLPLDSVTLIDYASTDRSVEIVKELAPKHWKLIPSRNADFCAAACDAEVMDIEKSLGGWKLALNTTEFLMIPSNNIVERLNSYGAQAVFCKSVGIAGGDNQDPQNIKEFMSAFDTGYMDSIVESVGVNTVNRSDRIIHNSLCGFYSAGRHDTNLPSKIESDSIFIGWAGYYPWNQNTIKRKLQIKERIPEHNKRRLWGAQHQWPLEKMTSIREQIISNSNNLLNFQLYNNTYQHCLSLL